MTNLNKCIVCRAKAHWNTGFTIIGKNCRMKPAYVCSHICGRYYFMEHKRYGLNPTQKRRLSCEE